MTSVRLQMPPISLLAAVLVGARNLAVLEVALIVLEPVIVACIQTDC